MMEKDIELAGLFATLPDPAPDEAFVAAVALRIARRRRLAMLWPAGCGFVLLLLVWASRPAGDVFAGWVQSGLNLIAVEVGRFATSPAGTFAAAILLVTGALWAWLYERLKA
ncbi:MAG TPA: hypothetical protein VGB91_11700 [Rhizomicrobium sp.]